MENKTPGKIKRMAPYQVLIIEDQPEIGNYCRRHISDGFSYDQLKNGRQVGQVLKSKDYDLILLDKNFSHNQPDELLGSPSQASSEGIEILKKIKEIDNELPIIMITSFGDQESVSAAIRLGAFDYAEADILAQDEMILRRKMENAIGIHPDDLEQLVSKYNSIGLVGRSKAMIDVFRQIQVALKSDAIVLLLGETGVGKDLIAKAIHTLSNRKDKPFIRCDMAQTDLMEPLLFGIEKGVATGVDARKGFFEMAGGGVLFLNEIGELPLGMQSKLLVALEDREFYRKGGSQPVKFDARIIAATNTDLREAVTDGKFRKDLYSRLDQIKIEIPSLTERVEDIPPLLQHYLDYHCRENNLPALQFTEAAINYMAKRTWPGNIREIKSVTEYLATTCEGSISIKDVVEFDSPRAVPAKMNATDVNASVFEGKTLQDIERDMMIYTLKRFDGYVKPACEAMKVSRAKFYSRINQYNLKHLVKGYTPSN